MKINFNTQIFGKQFIFFNTISNTNDYVKNNINKLENGAVILTTNQTNGRGSKNHIWKSLKNESIAISILLKNIPTKLLKIFPIMAAISITDMLNLIKIKNAKIKWFNDIVIDGKKIAGLLCESIIQKESSNIIIGIGININGSNLAFKKLKLNQAGSILTQTGKKYDISLIVKLLVESLEDNFKIFSTNNREYIEKFFKDKYIHKCSTIGKNIKILKKDKIIIAKAMGISKNGNLICEKDNVCFKINSNEVSIREIL